MLGLYSLKKTSEEKTYLSLLKKSLHLLNEPYIKYCAKYNDTYGNDSN